MKRIAVVLATGVLSCGFVASPCAAVAEALPPVTESFCAGALNLARIVHALAGATPTQSALQGLESSDLTLTYGASTVSVSHAGRTIVVPWNPPAKRVCLTEPDGVILLATAPTIPGRIVAEAGAVLQYRRGHNPWPVDLQVNVDFAETYFYMEQRGKYEYVSIVDFLLRHTPRTAIEGCLDEEHYRVDPSTLDVLPYNGCFMSRSPVQLPTVLQLPQ